MYSGILHNGHPSIVDIYESPDRTSTDFAILLLNFDGKLLLSGVYSACIQIMLALLNIISKCNLMLVEKSAFKLHSPQSVLSLWSRKADYFISSLIPRPSTGDLIHTACTCTSSSVKMFVNTLKNPYMNTDNGSIQRILTDWHRVF